MVNDGADHPVNDPYERPWPKTEEALMAYIRSLTDAYKGEGGFTTEATVILGADWTEDQRTSYDLGPEVMWMAAIAAFDYAGHVVGASGFQADFAGMEFLRHTRGYKGPFGIINGEHMLYPQYDLRAKLDEWLHEWREWARDEAQKRLDEHEEQGGPISQRVLDHWKALASS